MTGAYGQLIFDLDGTLVDSSGDIGDCLCRSFSEVLGMARPPELEAAWLGLPLKEIVMAAAPGLDAAGVNSVCVRFRELYDASDYPRTSTMPGAEEALAALGREGKRLFIATNKPLKPTLRIVAKLGLSSFFREIVCPDLLPGKRMTKSQMLAFIAGKWELVPAATLMVGDTVSDVLAARENGMPCAYYTSGYGGTAAAGLSPDISFSELSALPSLA